MQFLRTTLALTALLACFALTACASASPIRTGADHDLAAKFESWKTWDFATVRASATADIQTDVHREIRNAIESNLARHGYQRLTKGRPDFVVAYHGELAKPIGYSGYNDLYATSPYEGRFRKRDGWSSGRSLTRSYGHAALVVDCVDVESRYVTWRGYAAMKRDAPLPPERRRGHLDEALRGMLTDFPPQ